MNDLVSPHNIELEQQILGAVLSNNDRYHSVGAMLRADHFFDPVHGKIWRHIASRISKDHLASPVTLKSEIEDDLKELGGAKYLTNLVGYSISGDAIVDYSQELIELSERRRILDAARDVIGGIADGGNSQDAISALEIAAMNAQENSAQPRSMSLLKAHMRSLEAMSEAQATGHSGISSGLKDLDDLLLLKPKRSTLIAGATSMGKTTLATWLAYSAAKQGYGVGFVSLEMGEEDLANRINSIDSRVPYQMMDRPMSETMFNKVAEAAQGQQSLSIEIMSDRVRDIPAILSEAKRLRARWKPNGNFHGLGLLIIDYIQLVRGKGNSFEVLSQVSRDSKSIAKMLNLPVVALAQISRDMSKRDSKVPHLGDLRGSGDLENDADNVIFTHRPGYFLERMEAPSDASERADWEAAISACKGTMDIIVGKQRMGPLGSVRVGCDMGTNRFWDFAKQEEVDF